MERSIEVVATLRADVQSARQILRDSPADVFGEVEHDDRGLAPHVFRTKMSVVVGSGATVEHEVLVDVGRVPGDEQPLFVDLDLHPVDHAPVLPSFEGAISVTRVGEEPTTLTLAGAYTAPLGPVGAVGDSLLGHRVAKSSMGDFVERLAERLDEIDSRCRDRELDRR